MRQPAARARKSPAAKYYVSPKKKRQRLKGFHLDAAVVERLERLCASISASQNAFVEGALTKALDAAEAALADKSGRLLVG